ncbi:DEAD-domain-containing protein [Hesseltinella vesiculosa]|uniref:ATP-dependent RNA helicase n=1 Tax=Hesseltinella vesiculosa TaxID=101127 RepID=A0A1X2GBY7_9FUNG|nr:DEAD-domain-containing protein [Hesseltinella vesiculosa]
MLHRLAFLSQRATLVRHGIHQSKLIVPKIGQSLLQRQYSAAAAPEVVDAAPESAPEKPMDFKDIEMLHPDTQRALDKVFKYKTMSPVQQAVLTRLPTDNDMFVKAKTGTGKTLAFLIAALESVTKNNQQLKYSEGTSILIISPTRELAHQIAVEAKKLVKFYPFKVHCLVGGEKVTAQKMQLSRNRCDIVVATPGRLNDLLGSFGHLRRACENLKVLVLDEADQLLDMGFKRELGDILEQLPAKRQTLLFSATLSDTIRHDLSDSALSPNYDLIDTVGDQDVQTHLHVKQSSMVLPYDGNFLSQIQHIMSTHPAANQGKVIVFLPTTKQTMLFADVLHELLPRRRVHEIHSLKNQSQRARISRNFRQSRNDILVTTDVSARGVDYPGVSLVLQIGVPSTREQYIHRIGRTGRAGKEGEGILILSPWEKSFLRKECHDIPIEKLEAVPDLEPVDSVALANIGKNMDRSFVREVYTAYLGFYSSRLNQLGLPRSSSLEAGGEFLNSFGITDIPELSPSFKQQLGLVDRRRQGSSRGSRGDRFGRDQFSDRPRRSFSRDDDSFDRRPRRSFSRDDGDFDRRPRRSFSRGDDDFDRRPRRTSEDGDDFERRPRRSFSVDEGDASERPHRHQSSRSRSSGRYDFKTTRGSSRKYKD